MNYESRSRTLVLLDDKAADSIEDTAVELSDLPIILQNSPL
jgi:hypothetical protein